MSKKTIYVALTVDYDLKATIIGAAGKRSLTEQFIQAYMAENGMPKHSRLLYELLPVEVDSDCIGAECDQDSFSLTMPADAWTNFPADGRRQIEWLQIQEPCGRIITDEFETRNKEGVWQIYSALARMNIQIFVEYGKTSPDLRLTGYFRQSPSSTK